mmetsp:Transcript_11272/g.34510  ORF Transcript_11272/g.34510 Transcript_11272/m.34510 type:complete len:238 (+) Transcript_11272:1310-2023(+)
MRCTKLGRAHGTDAKSLLLQCAGGPRGAMPAAARAVLNSAACDLVPHERHSLYTAQSRGSRATSAITAERLARARSARRNCLPVLRGAVSKLALATRITRHLHAGPDTYVAHAQMAVHLEHHGTVQRLRLDAKHLLCQLRRLRRHPPAFLVVCSRPPYHFRQVLHIAVRGEEVHAGLEQRLKPLVTGRMLGDWYRVAKQEVAQAVCPAQVALDVELVFEPPGLFGHAHPLWLVKACV